MEQWIELLNSPAVAAIISLTVIVVTALLRDRFGESDADAKLKQFQQSAQVADALARAAYQGVVEVENTLKKTEGMSNEELKLEAMNVTMALLKTWGIVISENSFLAISAAVENAYQVMKVNNG